jgi:3-oxoadipate enol-lactonase
LVFVLQTGSSSTRAVLLLHALGLDHSMWRPQTEALHDLLVLAPDLPGLGRSRSEPGGLDAAVDECAAFLRSRDLVAVVGGVSYGGYVAALLAAEHPDLVAGLALSGVRRQVPRRLAQLQAAMFRGVRARGLSRGETVSRWALAAEKRNLVSASSELGRVDLRSALPRIKAPTVVFAPARDWFVRREVAHLAAIIPEAEVVAIRGAGHLWTERLPQPLIDVIRNMTSAGEHGPASSAAWADR